MVSIRVSLGLGLYIGLFRVMIRVNPLVPNPAFDSIDPLYRNRPYTALKFYIQISGSTVTQSGEYFGNQFYVHWRCNGTTRVLSIIPFGDFAVVENPFFGGTMYRFWLIIFFQQCIPQHVQYNCVGNYNFFQTYTACNCKK